MDERRRRLLARWLFGLGAGCLLSASALFATSLRIDGTSDRVQQAPRNGADGLPTGTAGTLAAIRVRGHVICGLDLRRPGLAEEASSGNATGSLQARGLEVDLCRAVAVALFGSDEGTYAVRSQGGSTGEALEALAADEIDLLFRSMSIDTLARRGLAARVGPIAHHETIALLVDADRTDADPPGGGVCVMRHTFARQAIEAAGAAGVAMPPIVDADADGNALGTPGQLLAAWAAGRCSALGGRRHELERLCARLEDTACAELVPLDARFHEPVPAVVARGDDPWFEIVSHTIWTLLDAELKGRDRDGEPGSFRRVLWESLGLDGQSGSRMIRTVGNYGEIARRHLGDDPGPDRHHLLGEGRLFAPR